MTKRAEPCESKPKARGPGRPVTRHVAPPIPDTPENIAKAVLATRSKKEGDWKYLRK